jgi:hypothetical protein
VSSPPGPTALVAPLAVVSVVSALAVVSVVSALAVVSVVSALSLVSFVWPYFGIGRRGFARAFLGQHESTATSRRSLSVDETAAVDETL